jgi:hypothetical protein
VRPSILVLSRPAGHFPKNVELGPAHCNNTHTEAHTQRGKAKTAPSSHKTNQQKRTPKGKENEDQP